MKNQKIPTSNTTNTTKTIVELPQTEQPQTPEKSTFGQSLAEAMATKVGSWSFLTVQTGILAGWVTMNMIPGVPHWDEQPFILLNLVFSFASAYTAPIVLMSQNRQSEEDRKNALLDHQTNRKAAYGIELLHKKIDALQEQHRLELSQLREQQQQHLKQVRVNLDSSAKNQLQSKGIEVEKNNFILKPVMDTNNVVIKVIRKTK